MANVVSRLKAGGCWDAIIGRFSWWILDGPPILESFTEPILDSSVVSIEQLAFASSLIHNCCFKFEPNALRRVIEWGNSMRKKGMF